MSTSQIKNLSKNELKSILMKMGTSLDKIDRPKSYYEKLYLEKMNAKNKRTRSNNIFGREHILNTKRERNDKKNQKDEDYVIEKDEENNSNQEEEEEEDNNENENISVKSDESDQNTEGKKQPDYKFKRFTTKDIIEKNKNYKESGIKYIRLIQMKKKKEKENKKYFINQTDNKNNPNISEIKNEELEGKVDEFENDQHEKDNNKVSPLKQSKKYSENNNIGNNDISNDNKNDISLKVNENYSSEKKPILEKQNQNTDINHISFGAPKTYEKNNNILLSNGPISFGFNQTTNTKNLGNTASNKDNNSSDIKPKKYNTFVKNISEAVKENIKDNQNSTEKKARTILLKWESPRQKEFMAHSMDSNNINNNLENTDNKINIEYNFNERLENFDDQATKLRQGYKNKNEDNSPFNNNYIKPDEKENIVKMKNNILDKEENYNEYKNKLRSHDKNKKQYIEDKKDDNNNNNCQKIIDNPFYTDVNKEKKAEKEYIDSQNIYDSSIPTESIYNSKNIFNSKRDLNPNNNYYYNKRNYSNENNNMQEEDNNQQNEDYMMNNSGKNKIYNKEIFTTPNAQNPNKTNIKNDYNMTLEDKIKYYNEDENININTQNDNNYQQQVNQQKRKNKFLSKISRMKNSIMNKFKNNKYIFPLLLLITFGIVYFLNNSYERFDNFNIIMIFSILIGLLILYNLLKYLMKIRNYKKMARADRIALLEMLNNNNITRESLANNMMLISNFICTRIDFHKLSQDEYMKYVFHYLKKYLEKDGFKLNKEENNDNIKHEFWKEI